MWALCFEGGIAAWSRLQFQSKCVIFSHDLHFLLIDNFWSHQRQAFCSKWSSDKRATSCQLKQMRSILMHLSDCLALETHKTFNMLNTCDFWWCKNETTNKFQVTFMGNLCSWCCGFFVCNFYCCASELEKSHKNSNTAMKCAIREEYDVPTTVPVVVNFSIPQLSAVRPC